MERSLDTASPQNGMPVGCVIKDENSLSRRPSDDEVHDSNDISTKYISSAEDRMLERPAGKPNSTLKISDDCVPSDACCLEDEHSYTPDGSTEGETCQEGVPTDQGWSWLVCFSVFTITLLQFGHDQAIFVLFVDFVEEFQQSVSVMTSMFTIFSLTSAFSSLFTSNVLMYLYSSRQITCSAAILGSTLTFLLSRAPNVLCVLVVFGLKGLCFGALLVCPTSLLGFYFKRRIALATAISNTGLCAAFILFPGLTQMLREEYGLRGTLLILSALELHIVLVGMFLRPIETYRKLHRLKINRMLAEAGPDIGAEDKSVFPRDKSHADTVFVPRHGTDDADMPSETETLCADNSTYFNGNSKLCDSPSSNSFSDKKILKENYIALSTENSELQELNSSIYACAQTDEEHLPLSQDQSVRLHEEKARDNFPKYQERRLPNAGYERHHGTLKKWIGCCYEHPRKVKNHECEVLQSWKHGSKVAVKERVDSDSAVEIISTKKNITGKLKAIFDTSLLKIWPFRMVLLANGLGTFTSYVNIYMPTVAVQAGLTKGQAASLLTVVGALDFCSRVVLGYLADTGLVAKTKIVSVCLACIAVLCHLNRLYTTYVQFLVYAACVGLTCGCRHNLLNVILIDHLGVTRLAKGLGLCSLLNTALLAANHLTIGLLLDATGSFVVPMHFVGTVVLAGSLLYFAEPVFVRLEKARKGRETGD